MKKSITNNDNNKAPSFIDILLSVLSAMIGVQSDKNRERDFNQGKLSHYIVVGVIVVIVFVFTLIAIVNNILEQSAS